MGQYESQQSEKVKSRSMHVQLYFMSSTNILYLAFLHDSLEEVFFAIF